MGLEPARDDFAPLDPAPTSSPQQAVGPYLRAIGRHWPFVVAVTLLAAGVAAATMLKSGLSYQATSSVLVTPQPGSDPTFVGVGVVIDSGDPARTVQTAAALINSPQAATRTAAEMGKGWTLQKVQNAVNVTPLGQSDVLAITAKASTPTDAQALADEFATNAVAVRGAVVQQKIATELAVLQAHVASNPSGSTAATPQTTDLATRISELSAARATGGDPTLSVSQRAVRPTSPTGAPRWLVVLLAYIGGFAVSSVGALGLEYFSRPVRDEEELTALFPAPILATIPRVRTRRRAPLSPWQLPPAAFEQIRMLRVQLELGLGTPVVMITSAGAGDGKTTLVAALSAAFSESGREVILMDLDLRRPSLAKVLALGDADPVALPTDESETWRAALVSVPRLPNVKLLQFPHASMAKIDAVMRRLPVIIAQAQRRGSVVILDTAPIGEVSEALRVAPMTKTVVFVARPRHTDRRRLILARNLLTRAGTAVAGLVVVGQPAGRAYGGYYGYAHSATNGLSEIAEPEKARHESRP